MVRPAVLLLVAHREWWLLRRPLMAFFTFVSLLSFVAPAFASSALLPGAVRSSHFVVTVHGERLPVMHATSNYYLLNFDVTGPTDISVTADDPHFWDSGVEVQPMRYGIRPHRRGGTLSFAIPGPVKLSITRPGQHFAESQMLFLFGNPPASAPDPKRVRGLRYYGPGEHHENIDAQSGDRIFLAPGAVIFGALNIWQVHDVRVFGTGTIIYDGPQNPKDDEGWIHRRNWHCIVMDQATNIEIDGITCVTRSRTWQVQMKDSRHIGFYNVKIVGGNPNNANQDGLDWLGGGDTTVSDSFFRASDDVFAMQGNWNGYEPALLREPGHDVTNVTIESSVASTSISNTLRVGWPEKTFNSAHIRVRDVDVIHMGFGACEVPFALFELWADPGGLGSHRDYRFENIRLEDWYSLFQIQQNSPQIRDISFNGVWAVDGPAMTESDLKGDVKDVRLVDATTTGSVNQEIAVQDGAEGAIEDQKRIRADFIYSAGILRARQPIRFTASGQDDADTRFEWILGDGTIGQGHSIEHRFHDAEGTLMDGSGRFRVLLHVTRNGLQTWSSQSVVLETAQAVKPDPQAVIRVNTPAFEGAFDVPEDGGYTFTLITNAGDSLSIDDRSPVSAPAPQAQVCGTAGNAIQPVRDSAVLRKGRHVIRVMRNSPSDISPQSDRMSSPEPRVLWEGPNLHRQALHIQP